MPLVFVKAYDRSSPTKGGHKVKHEIKPYVHKIKRHRLTKEEKKQPFKSTKPLSNKDNLKVKWKRTAYIAAGFPLSLSAEEAKKRWEAFSPEKQKKINRAGLLGNMSVVNRRKYLDKERKEKQQLILAEKKKKEYERRYKQTSSGYNNEEEKNKAHYVVVVKKLFKLKGNLSLDEVKDKVREKTKGYSKKEMENLNKKFNRTKALYLMTPRERAAYLKAERKKKGVK